MLHKEVLQIRGVPPVRCIGQHIMLLDGPGVDHTCTPECPGDWLLKPSKGPNSAATVCDYHAGGQQCQAC
jgi:hypothetical protein